MSVAFRRESDEDHKEPRFELPLPPGPNLVTPRGLGLIEAKAEALRAAIAAASGNPPGNPAGSPASSPVDASADNAATEALRRELRYWDTRRVTAELAPAPAPGEAGIGSTVAFTHRGRPRTVQLTGHDEADAATGETSTPPRVAFASPLGQALMGAMAGDVIDFAGSPLTVASVA